MSERLEVRVDPEYKLQIKSHVSTNTELEFSEWARQAFDAQLKRDQKTADRRGASV